MASIYFLIVDKGFSSLIDLVGCPLAVGDVAKVILGANEHSGGEFSDSCEVNIWRSSLAVLLNIFLLTPIVESERFRVNDLTIMNQTLDTCPSWEVRHIHSEPILVIKRWILGDQKALPKETNIRDSSAD